MAIEVVPAVVIEPRRPVWAEIGLAVAVGMVLADASVVVLALPDMLTALDATVTGISWVITAFNLAAGAGGGAGGDRRAQARGRSRVEAAGLVVFAAASAAAALAGSLETVIAARCVQAVSGAAVVCAALELLPAVARSTERGVERVDRGGRGRRGRRPGDRRGAHAGALVAGGVRRPGADRDRRPGARDLGMARAGRAAPVHDPAAARPRTSRSRSSRPRSRPRSSCSS